ncbi:MAG: hypothetical protein KDA20_05870 [Phycisphaerales bacterium]|nr:hypothetical protein [Phycisphaerales bacterium]
MAKGGQGPKVAIAAVFFIAAAVAVAWQMGAFGSGAPKSTKSAEERQAEAERMRKLVESGEAKEQPTLQAE